MAQTKNDLVVFSPSFFVSFFQKNKLTKNTTQIPKGRRPEERAVKLLVVMGLAWKLKV